MSREAVTPEAGIGNVKFGLPKLFRGVESSVVRVLVSRGKEVIAADLDNRDQEGYVRCDVRAFRQLERVFEFHRFDYVYHLAAEYGRWNGEDYYENLWQTNSIGVKNVIR